MPFFKKKDDKKQRELKIKRTIAVLKVRKRGFENKASELRQKAKEAIRRGQRQKAISLLRRSKYYERQVLKYEGMLQNLETITTSIEIGEDTKIQAEALRESEALLRETVSEIRPEKIGETMSTISSHMETIEMAGDLSSEPLDMGTDESSIDAELERLTMEVALEKEFPEIPKEPTKEEDKDILDELEELKKEAEKEKS